MPKRLNRLVHFRPEKNYINIPITASSVVCVMQEMGKASTEFYVLFGPLAKSHSEMHREIGQKSV